MTCKPEAPVVTMVAAVCDRALAELDPADPDLAPLVSQLEKTRDEAADTARRVGACADARAT
jgi:hypothetical protein